MEYQIGDWVVHCTRGLGQIMAIEKRTINGAQNLALTGARTVAPVGAGLLVGALGGQRGVYAPAAPGQAAPAVTAVTSGKNVVNIWQGRSCTNCHTQVHGSNNPSVTNPTPQFLFR